MKTLKDCVAGDTIYIQSEYDLEKGEFVKLNKKSVKVRYSVKDYETGKYSFYDRYEKIEKVAHAEEKIAVIWERWKGNGRGGYRLEKELYPEYRIEAKNWPYQAYLFEDTKGTITSDNLDSSRQNMQVATKIPRLIQDL